MGVVMSLRSVFGSRRPRALLFGALSCLLAVSPGVVLAQEAPAASADAQPGPPVKAPASGMLSEPGFLADAINFVVKRVGDGTGPVKNGFYPEFSNMVTGSGWLGAGPGYRQTLFNKRAFADVSAALSWHTYLMAQGRFELTSLANSHLAIGTQAMWRDSTQVSYFGIGAATPEDDRSLYRVKSTDVVGYATARPNKWLAIGGELGWLKRPQVRAASGAFKPGYPDTLLQFPNDPGVSLSIQPNFLHGEVSITADTRDNHGHPTSGGLYRAAVLNYTDQSTGTFSFRQLEAEAAQFIPVADGRLVIALHGWTVLSDVGTGHAIPFYLMPSVGGNNTLRDYTEYRFHDNDMVVVNAEARLAMFTHMDVAAFVDAGSVAPRAGDLSFDKTSYGAGLRLHTERVTLARLDVANGAEGWRFVFRTSDPLRLSRLSRRLVAIPFAP